MNILKHWKRYLAIGALVTGLAVAPVAAQEVTPEPTPVGGTPPSDIPTPGEVTTDLSRTIVAAFIAVIGSPLLLELIIGLVRFVPALDLLDDDTVKGIVSGIGIILYVAAGVFGFTGQYFNVASFLEQFLPLVSGIIGLFILAPKYRASAVRYSIPVMQQAAAYKVQRAKG